MNTFQSPWWRAFRSGGWGVLWALRTCCRHDHLSTLWGNRLHSQTKHSSSGCEGELEWKLVPSRTREGSRRPDPSESTKQLTAHPQAVCFFHRHAEFGDKMRRMSFPWTRVFVGGQEGKRRKGWKDCDRMCESEKRGTWTCGKKGITEI